MRTVESTRALRIVTRRGSPSSSSGSYMGVLTHGSAEARQARSAILKVLTPAARCCDSFSSTKVAVDRLFQQTLAHDRSVRCGARRVSHRSGVHMRRSRRSSNTRSVTRMVELAVAAPQVIATRSARMLAAGANPGAADRAEFSKMWTEKGQAFWESLFAMGVQMVRVNQDYARTAALQWWRLWTTPWWLTAIPRTQPPSALSAAALLPLPSARQRKRAVSRLVDAGLGPIHKRATANARRLSRTRKR